VNIDQASITQITNVPLLTGGGLKFPATQVASADANTLDDYEEGTWTPTQGSGLTVVGTFSSSGRYTKIGKIVTLEAYLSATTSLTLSGTGSSIICGGVPFPPAGTPTGDARCNGVAINEAITASTSVQISQFSIYNAQTMAATNNIRITITYGTV
jgi:hypothetical protein